MYSFIVNPASSSGRGLAVWKKVQARLNSRGVPYEFFLLGGPGEAAPLARELSSRQEPCTLIVLGGDGTINEVLDGIENPEFLTFACIPSGSGNDFVRGLSLPRNPMEALEAVLHPQKYISVNIGCLASGSRRRAFGVSSGIGFDASVCNAAYRSALKDFLNTFHAGKLVYMISALKILFAQKRFSLTLTMDEKTTLSFSEVYFAAAMNLPCEGGGFRFCPEAEPGDNLLDLCILNKVSRIYALFLLPLALPGKHVNKKGVHILRCRKAELQASIPLCVHTDGEIFGFEKNLSVSLAPRKLKVIQG